MDTARGPWPWRAGLASVLAYTLAFNLTFLVQELGLVLPKALVPGLAPVLYHNNHAWSGASPLAELFQGTGALATLVTGLCAGLWLRRTGSSRAWLRLLAFWLAFAGLFMALAQIALAPVLPQGDVARALDWLGLAPAARNGLALLAVATMPASALWLLGPLLGLAEAPARTATAGRRMLHVFQLATLPGLLAVALIVPFRMPREWIEVVLVPLVVTAIGLLWLQLLGWWPRAHRPTSDARWPLPGLSLAVVALLAVFQLVLRRGIAF